MTPIPLSAPDGQVYAYACGRCHQVRCGMETFRSEQTGPVCDLVEWSLRDATRCCTCHGCGASSGDDFECVDCSRDQRLRVMWLRIAQCATFGITSADELDDYLRRVDEADDDEVYP